MTLIDNGLFAVPYPDLFSKAAYLLESLIGNHAFLDGNKRTAITSSGLFLHINGYRLTANNQQLETLMFECYPGAGFP
jgi:death-on-curing protein